MEGYSKKEGPFDALTWARWRGHKQIARILEKKIEILNRRKVVEEKYKKLTVQKGSL